MSAVADICRQMSAVAARLPAAVFWALGLAGVVWLYRRRAGLLVHPRRIPRASSDREQTVRMDGTKGAVHMRRPKAAVKLKAAKSDKVKSEEYTEPDWSTLERPEAQAQAAAAWTAPDWAGLALAAPAPAPRPFTILFVGVNSNKRPDLNLKEEHKRVKAALDAEYGRASAHKPVLKHVAYSTWNEVLHEIRGCCPTVLHLGCHAARHAGIQLFRGEIQPERMLPAIKAWNSEADRNGWAQLRVIVVNACLSDGHAEKLKGCVDFTIGHAARVKDMDALVFSETLYACVCQGMSLAHSFDTARSAASLGYRIYANADPRAFCPGGAGNDGPEGPSGTRARTSGNPGSPGPVHELREVGVRHLEPGQVATRDAHMTRLRNWAALNGAHRIAVVGQGGSGKSTLAQWLLSEVGRGLRPSIRILFFLQAGDLMRGYRELLAELQRLLGREEEQLDKDEDVREKVHVLLRDGQVRGTWMGVLDDLPSPADLADHGMGWLLKEDARGFPWGSGKTVVTSRSAEWANRTLYSGIAVGNFEPAEAITFLTGVATHWSADEEDVAAVARKLSYFPLALASAAGCAKTYYLAPRQFLEELDTHTPRFLPKWQSRKRAAGEYMFEYADVVRLTWNMLEKAEAVRELLRKMAFLDPDNIPVAIFEDCQLLLPVLEDHSLVQVHRGPRILVSIHALTQQVIREHLMDGARAEALRAVVAALQAQMDTFDKGKPESYQACTCRAYTVHVKAVLEHVGDADASEDSARLAVDAGDFLSTVTSTYSEARYLYERALAYEEALEMNTKSLSFMTRIYGGLGNAHYSMGNFSQAIKYHTKHLAIARDVGDRAGEGEAYGGLGNAHNSMGDFSQAIEYHTQHLAIAREVDDRAGEGKAYGCLGNAHYSMGDFPQAIKYHTQHLAIARDVGDRAGEGEAYGGLGNAHNSMGDSFQAIEYHTQHLAIARDVGDRAGEGKAYGCLGIAHYSMGNFSQAIKYHTKHLAIARDVGDRAGEGEAYGGLGNAHYSMGDFPQAIEYHTQHLAIARDVGDRAGEGYAGHNLGLALANNGNLPAAARALVQALAARQRVERDLGAHDDRRVSLFEQQQITYMVLQGVLLGLEQPGWALGVAAQAKGRALRYHLTAGSPGHSNEDHASMVAPDGAYQDLCEAWWREVQQDAQAEGDAGAQRIVEYSFLSGDRLAIWVLKGTGELLALREVCASTVGENWAAAPEYMVVQEVLGAVYQHLLEPVEAHLDGATEVLIIPHKELSRVPWAALFDCKTGQYLIQRCVLRVAPSLRVARTAADTVREMKGPEEEGHALVVGNPLRTRSVHLPKAELEAKFVAELLRGVGFEVHALMGQAASKAAVKSKIEGAKWVHFAGSANSSSLMLAEKEKTSSSGKKHTPNPKKGEKKTLKLGAGKRLLLQEEEEDLLLQEEEEEEEVAVSQQLRREVVLLRGNVARGIRVAFQRGRGGAELKALDEVGRLRRMPVAAELQVREESSEEEEEESSGADLSMDDVQGSVCMGVGSTVVLSACNSGRGGIRAEGVMGLSRGFLFAGAAATVVSLWSVDDGSTAALMKEMYKHLKDGRTTAQALQLAMLHLLESGRDSRWRQPLYWAAFLVVGANTRLPGV